MQNQLMYRSESCLPFFSSVVKNVASPNIEIKKLVYIYLLYHAEVEPDLALLSINAIQKSLTDQNPLVRTMALRTMSGIRVPVISQIVSLAIKRGCGDMSPHVRKAAALAIPKCYKLDPSALPQLEQNLSTLLGDNKYFVVGPAVAAFLEVCPDRIDLIHKHYRSLVKKLVDMDEWSQLATLRLLAVYARKCFPRRTQRLKKSSHSKGFYDDDTTDASNEEVDDAGEEVSVVDPDLELFLKACKPLLQSRNSAVIVSIVRCYLHLGSREQLESTVGPLVALLRTPQDVQQIALYNIVSVAMVIPKSFVRYCSHFLIRSTDQPPIWRLKVEILTILFPHCGNHLKGLILGELEHFSSGVSDPELVRESVRAIGRCAESDPATSSHCLRVLLGQISSPDETLVSEALTVIRHLIQQDPAAHQKTVVMLAKHLDTTTGPEARASIIWLVGEFAGNDTDNNIAADVLRILVKGFANESEAAKQQILLLSAKVYLHHLNKTSTASSDPVEFPGNGTGGDVLGSAEDGDEANREDSIATLWRYVLLLGRYDTSYDLRDRARLYKALLAVPGTTQLASLLLLAPKPVPHNPTPSDTRKDLLLGSSTLVIGPDAGSLGLQGYETLPDWVEAGQEPDPKLRDEEVRSGFGSERANVTAGSRLDQALKEHGSRSAAGRANWGAAAKNKDMSLDDWLAEEGEEEEDEDEEEEEEDDDEEEYTEEEETTEEESSEEGDEEALNEGESEEDSQDNDDSGDSDEKAKLINK